MDGLACRMLLERLAGGPLPDWTAFAATVRTQRLAAGETLFRADVAWQRVVVVRSGLFRLVYLTEAGGERIKSFIGEGGFFASLAALAPDGRSTFAAVAMADAEVELLDHDTLRRFGDRHLAWQRALRVAIEVYGARKEKRERELLTMSAEQRYRGFVAEEPALAARVPLKDLALYLGITPVALSRIRGRMARAP